MGLSLSDPNVRRWLAWVQARRVHDIERAGGELGAVSTSHYWLNVRPKNEPDAKWLEASVAHLGIRLIWLRSWAGVEEDLCSLLGVTP
jgi:hypothetical protein